jgi:hypothetical protein
MGDDGALARVVALHSLDKAYYARYYADIGRDHAIGRGRLSVLGVGRALPTTRTCSRAVLLDTDDRARARCRPDPRRVRELRRDGLDGDRHRHHRRAHPASGPSSTPLGPSGWAKDTLDLAEEQHKLAQAQHDLERQQFEQRQADRERRAEFKLSVDLLQAAEGGLLTTASQNLLVRLRVGIENVGTLAAGRTTVNLLVPKRYYDRTFRWTGPNGEELPSMGGPDHTAEHVGEGDDAGPAAYLARELVVWRFARRSCCTRTRRGGLSAP